MRIEQLLHFIEVANQQSISKAAKKLFIAQPSLSISINNLEEELGIKLFHRSSSGVKITTTGQQIMPLARNIIRDAQTIRAFAVDEDLCGGVSLTSVPAACTSLITDLIIKLQDLHPKLSLQIDETRPKNVTAQVFKGEMTLGITSYFDFEYAMVKETLRNKGIKLDALYYDSLCIYVSATHPLVNDTLTTTIEQAGAYPFASFRKDILADNIFGELDGLEALDLPHIIYRFNDRENIKKIVAQNVAIALLPKSMAKEDIYVQEGLLIPLDVTDRDLRLTTGLIYKRDTILSLEEKKVIELLKQLAQKKFNT